MSERHEIEAEVNRTVWESKKLLRDVYASFYDRIEREIDTTLPGRIVELGSGIGNMADRVPGAICSDRFVSPWLDIAVDAYAMPFRAASVSNLILFDVFHHLRRPLAFLAGARRVLCRGGRLLLFEPYLGAAGWLAYGALHPEPLRWWRPIDPSTDPPPLDYYAAQGNATRIFFGRDRDLIGREWRVVFAQRFASFAYLLSGGFSRPAFYPAALKPAVDRVDAALSMFPQLFGARCLVVLTPTETA